MAPIGDSAPMMEDQEAIARQELGAIHPTIRAAIVKDMDLGVWKAMSFAEKLNAIKERLPSVSDDVVSQREKDIAAKVAQAREDPFGQAGQLDVPATEEDEEKEEEEQQQEAEEAPTYWAPSGRCPYGLDEGHWVISEEELCQHNSHHSCWIVIDGKVYDVTKWLAQHPGGAPKILEFAGGDATAAFRAIGHSDFAKGQLQGFHVGRFSCPEEDAKLELITVHPSILREISTAAGIDVWAKMSNVQRLEILKQKKAKVQQRLIDQGKISEPSQAMIVARPEGNLGGKCPYGFDQPNGGDAGVRAGDTEQDGSAAPKCPVSGKTGECPMQQGKKDSAPKQVDTTTPPPAKSDWPLAGTWADEPSDSESEIMYVEVEPEDKAMQKISGPKKAPAKKAEAMEKMLSAPKKAPVRKAEAMEKGSSLKKAPGRKAEVADKNAEDCVIA